MNVYDYIIIGGGISGLYCGYKLILKNIKNFIIIEKECEIGGRIKTCKFYNRNVATGAGIGRYEKDKTLLKLLDDLKIEHHIFENNIYYSDKIAIMNIKNILSNIVNYDDKYNFKQLFIKIYNIEMYKIFSKIFKLNEAYDVKTILKIIYENIENIIKNRKPSNQQDLFDKLVQLNTIYLLDIINVFLNDDIQSNKYKTTTFKKYSIDKIGKNAYEVLIKNLSYTDYEDEDVYNVFLNYNIEDNYENKKFFSIKWKILIEKLNELLYDNIITNNELLDYNKTNNIFEISTKYSVKTDNTYDKINKYFCKNLIFSNNLEILNKKYDIYKNIDYQPFIRIYVKIDVNKSFPFLQKIRDNGFLVVNNELCKIITIDKQNGLFMIAYSDNQNAKYLYRYITDKSFIETLVNECLDISNSIKITDIIGFFWKVGTHYVKYDIETNDDLYDYINPDVNIYCIGEAISINKGWVSPALDTVDFLIKNIL